jgi:hypothetical protein
MKTNRYRCLVVFYTSSKMWEHTLEIHAVCWVFAWVRLCYLRGVFCYLDTRFERARVGSFRAKLYRMSEGSFERRIEGV